MTVRQALIYAREKLEAAQQHGLHPDLTPALDAAVLLAFHLGVSRSYLAAHDDLECDGVLDSFYKSVSKRSMGYPVAYLTGVKEFWGRPFSVSPATLIPKPDTETLIERALHIIPDTPPFCVLDVCTGSGCIAITLKAEKQHIQCVATDISNPALDIARTNAQTLLQSPNAIRFIQGDLRQGLPKNEGTFDLVVSNPPYVPSLIAKHLLNDGRSEPLLALDGGSDGLDLVRSLIDHLPQVVKQGGKVLIETGEYNAQQASEYLNLKGFTDIVIHADLSGQERVVEGSWK
ncbi:MAG: peptide chain release factor N(5)-glutamine methyltransferase [Spirochaetales bacterium]|nr:peptide chain release factor N(5)-glutamine methyltransferase [Spirochaetales bacterium]